MPFISVEILEGRSIDQRRQFAREVTRAAVDCLGAKPEKVRVRFVELKPHDLARNGVLVLDENPGATADGGASTGGATS